MPRVCSLRWTGIQLRVHPCTAGEIATLRWGKIDGRASVCIRPSPFYRTFNLQTLNVESGMCWQHKYPEVDHSWQETVKRQADQVLIGILLVSHLSWGQQALIRVAFPQSASGSLISERDMFRGDTATPLPPLLTLPYRSPQSLKAKITSFRGSTTSCSHHIQTHLCFIWLWPNPSSKTKPAIRRPLKGPTSRRNPAMAQHPMPGEKSQNSPVISTNVRL